MRSPDAIRDSTKAVKSKHVGLDLQLDSEALEHIGLDTLRQLQQLRPRGLAIIDQHQRLQTMHAGVALAKALPPCPLDQPASRQFDQTITRRLTDQIGMLGANALG